jgi:hypothetical protein
LHFGLRGGKYFVVCKNKNARQRHFFAVHFFKTRGKGGKITPTPSVLTEGNGRWGGGGGVCRALLKKRTANSRICRTPPSQNICTCWWLLRFTFDHLSYSKKLWKCYLFCYDMFYHRIHFKFCIFANTLFLYFRKYFSFVFSQKLWKCYLFC